MKRDWFGTFWVPVIIAVFLALVSVIHLGPDDLEKHIKAFADRFGGTGAKIYAYVSSPLALLVVGAAVGFTAAWRLRPLIDGYRASTPVEPQNQAPNEIQKSEASEKAAMIFTAKRLKDLLLVRGDLQLGSVDGLIEKVDADHLMWYDIGAYEARKHFLLVARDARKIRSQNGDPVTFSAGDFNPAQRKSFEGMLTQRFVRLNTELSGKSRAVHVQPS